MSIEQFAKENPKWLEYAQNRLKKGVSIDDVHAEIKRLKSDVVDFTVVDMQSFFNSKTSIDLDLDDDKVKTDVILGLEINKAWQEYEKSDADEQREMKSSLRDEIEFKLLCVIRERLDEGRIPKDEVATYKAFK